MRVLLLLFLINVFINADDKSLSVQLRWYHQFQFAGYYAALEKNFYRDAGLEVRLIEGGPTINPVKEVLLKRADIGVSNSSLVIEYLRGEPVVMLGVIFQHSPNVLLTSEKFKSPVDFAKGGTIALIGGDQDVELKAMFLKEGIDLKKVNFVSQNNNLGDLLQNRVDAINAYASNEPFVMKDKNIPYQILEPRKYGLDFYGDAIFTTQELIKNSPKNIEKFREATMKGWKYALKNQEEIISLILEKYNTQKKSYKRLKFEAEVSKQLINPDIVQIGHSNPGRWEHIVETYRLFNLVKNERALDKFYYKIDAKRDMTWFYIYVATSISLLIASGLVVFYIYGINKKLQKTLLRHKVLFENSASAGIVWDENFAITAWNMEAKRVFGWSYDEVIGRNIFDFLISLEDLELAKKNLKQISKDEQLYLFSNKNLTKDGRVILCEWHNTLLPKIDKLDKQEIVSLAIDITQRDKEEKILKQQALYDPLTSLPNRHNFEKLLKKQLKSIKRGNPILGVGFVDLDGFKNINDTFGHEAGDFLLMTLAKRFQEVVKEIGTVARMGGDEFAFIIKSDNYKEDIEGLLCAASTKITYENTQFQVTASIGIYFIDRKNSETISEILKKADTSMYDAKRLGKNQYQIYNRML
ncbi:MAG: ABC transporter substrate-binding protein [Sulfurimonas sp.]|nr:ABC transporter substrate-binding protein [Sulfurimonas sp.]